MGSACQAVFVSGLTDGGGGPITALATDETADNPAAVSTHVYYATNAVFQDNATGGNLKKLSVNPVKTNAIVVHGTTVYWSVPFVGAGTQTVSQATVDGAGSETNLGSLSTSGQVGGLVYDATDSLLVGACNKGTTIASFTCTTGGATACSFTWTINGVAGLDVATDGTSLFAPDSDNGAIEASTLNGQNAGNFPLGTAGSGTNLLRVFGTGATGHLFWSNSGAPSLWRASLTGTGSFSLSTKKQIVTPATAAGGIAVDAANIYWTEAATGSVMYAPSSGSGTTTSYITMGASAQPMLLVADKQFLYFTFGTLIYRVALP